MNKKIILTSLLALILFGFPALSAQTFSGTPGSNIPGNTDGFYCDNAAVSVVNVDMAGRIGVHYEIESVSIGVTHEFPAEMQLSLVSPRGNIINLSIGNGGSLDGAYEATVFTDDGNDITNSIIPFSSNVGYRPQGNTFEDQFMNEMIAGDWTLEICDLVDNANGGVINEFSITFNQLDATPDPNPVYEIQVSSTNNVNVNLNEECQSMLVPAMVLNGNFDVDGDGQTPPDDAYFITIMDENPCNGPIIDGCGDFEFWVTAADTMPNPEEGFGGCSMRNVLEYNSVPLPSSGQSADVEITADTITLTTLGGSQLSSAVVAGFSYTFNRSGSAGFRFNLQNVPLGPFDMDIVRIRFDGTVTNVPSTNFLPINGVYTFAQPIDIEAGDILQIELRNQDGASAPGDQPSVAKVFDFFFIPTVAESSVIGSLPLGGFVNAADATPAIFTSIPNQDGTLFTSQMGSVMLNGLSPSIPRSFRVDGRTNEIINNSLHPEIAHRLNLAGGLPLVFDGCSEVDIRVVDQITSAGNCRDIVVTRTFVAQDDPECVSTEGPAEPTIATQTIVFSRPGLQHIIPPTPLVEIGCNGFNGTDNPLPTINNFPALMTATGPVFLDQAVDNIGVTFEDGARIATCDNTYKFVRTYSVVDWCNIDTISTFNQLVKVGDFAAPMITAPSQDLNFDGVPDDGPLVFSTNALNCTAFFDVTSGVTLSDDCSDVDGLSLEAYIYADGNLNNFPLGPFNETDLAMNIPAGEHIIRYISTDGCGNADTLDQAIRIADLNAPTAICEDGLNVSLNTSGSAIIMATDINEASIDDCSGTDLLYEIAFIDEDNNPISAWMPSLILNCSNIGTVRVGLRVTDDGNMNGLYEPGIDNSNFCPTIIMVEDQNNPVCIAPTSLIIACADLEGEFPSDLDAAFAADAEETSALLDARFGAPNGVDNCPGLAITQTVQDNRTDCGTGNIFRSFGVTDAQGFSALPNCNQTIQIAGSYNYSVAFPADQNNVNCIEPSFDDISIIDGSCDMITVGTRVDTFEATADECRLIRITYEVLNLCEYNTTSPSYVIPRDADNDGIPGEAIVLHVTPGLNSASIADDIAVIDRDLNRNNGNNIANLDTGNGGLVPGSNTSGYGQDASRGAFTYIQFISITDDTPPTLTIDDSNTTAMDTNGDCEADLDVNFTITDECSMDDVSFSAQVDLFANDANQDGTITLAEFIPSFSISASDITEISAGNFQAHLESLPIGRHAIRIMANDGCGNNSPELLVFTAEDATASTPICINGLTATLAADENGGGIAQVTARTFVVHANNNNDCSGPLEYAIYRQADANVPNFVPNINDTLLTVTCADTGNLALRIYAIDAMGMTDFCETVLSVQAFNDQICNPDNGNGNGGNNELHGIIAGAVATPQYENKEGVEINITAQVMGEFITYTNQNGNYIFQNLMEGDDYTIEPVSNPAVDLSMVTTGDLILISRHILDIQPFVEPYQYVAADVNNDQRVNIIDLISIRRVILGLTSTYPASDSWKFISTAHNFGYDSDQYLNDQLMTVYNVNDLDGSMLSANFMAIEMGNISDAVVEDGLADNNQSRSVSSLRIPDMELTANNYYEIAVPQPTHLLGFQTTLELDDELELLGIEYGTATEGDFNLNHSANGLIGIAHINQPQAGNDTPLFVLQIKANRSGQLKDMLQLNDRIVVSEAYVDEAGQPTVNDLALDFEVANKLENRDLVETAPQFKVDQNIPNPFRNTTNIDFYLPHDGLVELMVYDQQGRTLLLRQLTGITGHNSLKIERTELGNASGLLYYTIASEAGTITKKMLLLK